MIKHIKSLRNKPNTIHGPTEAQLAAVETLSRNGWTYSGGKYWERPTAKCTCPSGSGGLEWPCPVHPPEEMPDSKELQFEIDHMEDWEGKGETDFSQLICWLKELQRRRGAMRADSLQPAVTDNLPHYAHAIQQVTNERIRQQAKWGVQNHDPMTWLAILGEEFGEASQAALHDQFGGKHAGTFMEEMTHTAAVAVQIIEWLIWIGYQAPSPTSAEGQ